MNRDDLVGEIAKRATRVLETDTDRERDRYGDPVMWVAIKALRMGDRCLLVWHAQNQQKMIVGNSTCEEMLKRAKEIHWKEWGCTATILVDDAYSLPDRTRFLCGLLEKCYKTTPGVDPSRPADVLRVITTQAEAYRGSRWVWCEETFYLTQEVGIQQV